MLLFLVGMTGFRLTGDIFDMFVWFERWGVGLRADRLPTEDRGPIQGR